MYNAQPGIEIDYATGDSWISDGISQQGGSYVNTGGPETEYTNINNQTDEGREYVLNVNTKKFHLPTCSSVDSMSEKNKKLYEGTIYEIKQKGYTPCARRLEMYR